MLSRNVSRTNDELLVVNGLIGYWHYLQGINGATWNNIAPSTQGSFNGTFNGGITSLSDGVNFDGTNGYVNIGAFSPLNGLSTFTYQVLLTTPPVVANDYYFLGFYSDNNNYSGLRYGYGTYTYYNLTNGNGIALGSITQIGANLEMMVTLVCASDGMKIYYGNAQNNSSTRITPLIPTVNRMAIGAFLSGTPSSHSHFYKGKIKAVRMYNRALSIEEITQNFKVGNSVGL
jgi:hypothetical protein